MGLLHEKGRGYPEMRQCAYNLFRNNEQAELFCAVPEDRPVPSLVVAQAWTFERILRPYDVAPPGFHERAAKIGVRYNGFYLFQATAPMSPIIRSAYDSVSLLCRG